MVAAYPWLVGWCAAFVSQEARNRVAHTQHVRAPVKVKALRDLPSPGAGRASVTAPLCNWGGRAKGESSPRPQPGAHHTTRAPLPWCSPLLQGKRQEQAGGCWAGSGPEGRHLPAPPKNPREQSLACTLQITKLIQIKTRGSILNKDLLSIKQFHSNFSP